MKSVLERALSMDSRALALYRIALSVVILFDLALRLPDFDFFLTAHGPLPLSALVVDTAFGKVAFSLYLMSSFAVWPYLLYLLTALAALVLMMGRRCGWATSILYVLMLSLQNRTGVALDFGDRLILVGLFFGMFLPWDRALVYGQANQLTQTLLHPAAGILGLLSLGMCEVAFLHALVEDPSPLTLALALSPMATLLVGPRWRLGVLVVFGLLLAATWASFEVGLTPLVIGVGLLLWVPLAPERTEPRDVPDASQTPSSWPLAIAALVITTISLLAWLPSRQHPSSLRTLADFLALSPERGQAFPPSSGQRLHYVAVMLDGNGERHPIAPDTPLDSDYRKRLYLRSLNQEANWGLRYWLAYWYFRREERRQASESRRQVELYQKDLQGGQRLVARWPMTPLPRQRTP